MLSEVQNGELDDLYRCLSNTRRRTVLHCLRVADTPLSIDKLNTLVATHEHNIIEQDAQSEEDVYTTLYHKHLPLMTSAGVIDKTPQDEIVTGDYFEEIISLLGDKGVTIEVVCEECEERQLIVGFGVKCDECGSEDLSPTELTKN